MQDTREQRRRLPRALLLIAFLAIVAGYTSFVVYLWAKEEEFWFDPAPATYGQWDPADLAHEEVRFRSADGTQLYGWYVPHAQPRAYVLYCPGSGGNMSYYADALRKIRDRLRVTTLIFDYRGFGRSAAGQLREPLFVADARAARDELARRAGLPPNQLVLLGRSMGSSVAVTLAAEGGARGLILESAFSTLTDVTRRFYRWAPLRLPMRNRFDSLSRIAQYSGPLLVTHGEADHVVPVALAQRLYDAAPGPKQMVVMPGLDHIDWPDDAFYTACDVWLDSLPPMIAADSSQSNGANDYTEPSRVP